MVLSLNSKKRVLVTGATGFAGSHLLELLLSGMVGRYEVYGCKRRRSDMSNVSHIEGVKWVELELTDPYCMVYTMEEVAPDIIFHLGGQSFVPSSFTAPQETFNINALGTLNLLEAVRNSTCCNPVTQICGSSEEYGFVRPEETPIKETNQLRPLSPYGVSKVAADLTAQQYHHSYGLKTVVTRAHNHSGPRRGSVFATSNFAKQVAEVEKGIRKEISVGNLSSIRDITDVRDMVRAYVLATGYCKHGEVYNVCSGVGHSMEEILDLLIHNSPKLDIRVVQDPSRMRPSDVELLIGDCSKFKEATGWKPEIPLETTLKDLLKFWRERV